MTNKRNINPTQPTARLLLKVFRAFETKLLQELASKGFSDVTPSHLNLLRHLNPEGMTLSNLAADAALSKQAISKIAANLIEKGYLEITNNPDDARVKIICFSAKGNSLISEAVDLVKNIEREYQNTLGEAQYLALRDALQKLLEGETGHDKPDRTG